MSRLARTVRSHPGYGEPVKAELPDWPLPGAILAHRPDVTAWGLEDDRLHLWEVETDDSITHGHTDAQWRAFHLWATASGGAFWLAVPRDSVWKAESRIEQLDLKGVRIWPL